MSRYYTKNAYSPVGRTHAIGAQPAAPRIKATPPAEEDTQYEKPSGISDSEITKILRARVRGWSWERIASWAKHPLGIKGLEALRSNAYYKARSKKYAEQRGVKIEMLI